MEQYLCHQSKLTSFHCKTVMFFTMERLSPAVWREDRLIECIGYCLQTLELFFMRGFCPHYIIPEVNLFEGKITRRYQLILIEKIKEFLYNNLSMLYDLQIDSLGQRVQNPTSDMLEPRSTLFRAINNVLASDLIETVSWRTLSIAKELNPVKFRRLPTALSLIEDDNIFPILSRYERWAFSKLKPHIQSLIALVASSFFYRTWTSIYTRNISSLCKLKVASMFYCMGDLRRAADVLNDVERRYDDDVHAVCSCVRKYEGQEPHELISESTMNDWNYDTVIRKVALCVRFTRLEAFCVPPILLYEMNRAMNDDVQYRKGSEHLWMDMAVVDSRPYLFYLHYITYGKLGLRLRQRQALRNIINCFRNINIVRTMQHAETAENLLGHCWEMEGKLLMALRHYMNSVKNVPRNNAANWHIRRLKAMFKH
ncbi:uncharacterized protein LOC128244374 [Mya arenaria]|uniref:uncharacterized protein LOC128244374 n=1 Tax=Mya arenaria TaxID=6604 RepID=UPI0022E984E1|nr:uncharacterized protein LOC128244374 [Mya arenaria]